MIFEVFTVLQVSNLCVNRSEEVGKNMALAGPLRSERWTRPRLVFDVLCYEESPSMCYGIKH